MLDIYPIALARGTKGRFSHAYHLVFEECQRFLLGMVLSELEIWRNLGGTDADFSERFDSVFPPGYLRRDLQGAKNIVYDLLDILNSEIVRSQLKPIYTYVMFHILLEANEGLDDDYSPEERIPDGLKSELQKIYEKDEETIERILDWFKYSDVCIRDFQDHYDEDYMDLGFAEQVAQIYLVDECYREKLYDLDVDISNFFDLLPTDLWERCIDKYRREKMENAGENRRMQKKEYDFFISHASEDKATVAEPLAKALEQLGAKVWFDKYELNIGDSLRKSIDSGLRNARQGIVILSQIYFEKFWTTQELDGLFVKAAKESKTILPIRHGITADEVAEHCLLLADLFSLSTDTYSIEELARAILRAKQDDRP